MKVLRPSKNSQTQGYSSSHKGYDFSGKGDLNAYACFFGKVTQAKNSETRNWLVNTGADPYYKGIKRKLRTEDYGNYCKIKGEVDGKTYYALYAHLEQGSVLPVGTEIKEGKIIGSIGNTGNSTGRHLHFEVRTAENVNLPVEFVTEAQKPIMEQLPKDNVIRDFYKAAKEEFSDDEIKKWLQENKNLYEIFTSVLEGDGAVRDHLLKLWGLELNTDKEKLIEQQKDTIFSIKEVLRRVGLEAGQDSEAMVAKLEWLVNEYLRLKEEKKPKTIIKYQDKDYKPLFKIWEVLVSIEGGD